MTFGYEFYFTIDKDVLVLPITPEKVTIKSGSNNKTVTLINEGEVTLLKSPSLMEIEFEARFPMRAYPYSRWCNRRPVTSSDVLTSTRDSFQYYFEKFTQAKANRQPIRFMIVRSTPDGKTTWGTGISFFGDNLFSLEELSTEEDAEEGDDVIVSFKLKQYKTYGVKSLEVKSSSNIPSTTSTSTNGRSTDNKGETSETYTIKSGDCLWNIAKDKYGNGALYTKIYEENKNIIEETAKKYRGGKGSQKGHWIYPGTKLVIPPK